MSRASIKTVTYSKKKPTAFSRAKAARTVQVTTTRNQGGYPIKAFNKGYNRTSGYYGRFIGPNAENKFFDTTLTFNFDATPEVPATGQLVLIPQGVTESTRVGRKCVVKSLQLRGTVLFTPGAAAAAASTNAYMCLVLDKQCNGAAASYNDVMLGANIATGFTNLANSERFVTLKRMKWNLTSQAGATTAFSNVAKAFDFYHKCSLPLEFSSTTGAITELKSNNLFLIAGTDGQTDDTVSMSGQCRVRFSD